MFRMACKLLIRPVRRFKINSPNNLQKEPLTRIEEGYTTIYRFPYIRHIAVFNRLKVYQLAVTTVALPGSWVLAQANVMGFELVSTTFYSSFSLCAFLFGTSAILNKIVGFLYYNEDKNLVKIAYVDFWGRRKEKQIPIRDVVPISELPSGPFTSQLYLPLMQFSEKGSLKMFVKFGHIIDETKFNEVFLSDTK